MTIAEAKDREPMTTYQYTIKLDDSEAIMLEAALKHYLEHCNEQLAVETKAPYLAHKQSAAEVLSRINQDTKMMITSSFCR